MAIRRFAVAVTTAADGSFTGYTPPFAGRLLALFITGTLDVGTDWTITEEDTGAALATLTNVSSGRYQPRGATHGITGAASLYAAAGTAVEDTIPVMGRVKVVVAQGGNATSGTLHVYVDASEVYRTAA